MSEDDHWAGINSLNISFPSVVDPAGENLGEQYHYPGEQVKNARDGWMVEYPFSLGKSG